MTDKQSRNAQIVVLNDAFRQHPTPQVGHVLCTHGVNAKGTAFMARAFTMVSQFDAFTRDNDPYSEHDFGSIDLDGSKLFWKIDYYAKGNLNAGSEDPSDPTKTERVLTIMLAEEY